MTKQTELEEETTELDEALLDELAEKLETTFPNLPLKQAIS